uniref:protein-tyrosine-phosphatase n=1 Tax=Onchocerca volvulus TaxID=6282 RepID=A0A8R1TKH0_ONCVO
MASAKSIQTYSIDWHTSEAHNYINANYVDTFQEEKKFILMQSPMENTVKSFWAMIYQENVAEIVAMINYIEFQLRQGNSQERKILHIYLYTWHNKGTPERSTEVFDLKFSTNYNRKFLTKRRKAAGYVFSSFPERMTCFISSSPIVVCCLTDSGRSGTLAVLDIFCRKMVYTKKLSNGNILVNIQDTVLRVRT